jgi:hypothetical protein
MPDGVGVAHVMGIDVAHPDYFYNFTNLPTFTPLLPFRVT